MGRDAISVAIGEVHVHPLPESLPDNPAPILGFPYPSLGPGFYGREEVLLHLRELLVAATAGRTTAIAWKAVHGLGGVGKTRLAVEYASRFAAEYSVRLFVGAGSETNLRRNLAGMAKGLGLPESAALEEEARATAVVCWLSLNPGWLLVLDSVDDDTALQAVLALVGSLQGGHVLLTGRLDRWGAGIWPVELDLLTREAAVALLLGRTEGRRRATKVDPGDAQEIARELGNLPLALEQAGAYVAENRLTLAKYRAEWESQREAVLSWFDPIASHYPASVAVTWQTSVDRLSPAARRLLGRLAWLGSEPIPESLLDVEVPDGGEPKDGPAPGAALVESARYSLATRSATAPMFTVHRLVQDVTRRGPGGEGALREALGWVNEAFVGDPDDVRTWPVLEPLTPHARAVARFADKSGVTHPTTRLMNQIGMLLLAKALPAEAEPLMRRALEIDEASFGADHPIVSIRLNNLAQLLQTTNRLGEAEPLMRRALEIDEACSGDEHSNVAVRLNNLAQLLQATNRLVEAEPLMRRALEIDEASFGTEHPNVAIRLNNLATLLQATNRLVEVEPLMRRALEIDEASFGAEHPNVAIRLNNLAQLLQATNRLVEAEPLMRRALAIDEASFGAEHPNVAILLNNLANLLQNTNRLAEAEPLMHRALAIDETSFGATHPDVAIDLNNLAQLLQATNRLPEAEPLMRRALAIDEASFGDDHPNVAIRLSNLAQLFQATNRLAEAEPLMRRALAIDETSFGADHPEVARDLNNLALLLQDTNCLPDAEPLILRALTIVFEFRRRTGFAHPDEELYLENARALLAMAGRSETEIEEAVAAASPGAK
ncbi:MAG: tetratricopeptide repeat protein [Acidobacteriota bacterium]